MDSRLKMGYTWCNPPQQLGLGRVVISFALEASDISNETIKTCLKRHAAKDWGDLDPADSKMNDNAANPNHPSTILSSYNLEDGRRIWIQTEWDRSVTTIMFPEDR